MTHRKKKPHISAASKAALILVSLIVFSFIAWVKLQGVEDAPEVDMNVQNVVLGEPAQQPPPTPVEFCGDGVCNGLELCNSCTADCGSCLTQKEIDDMYEQYMPEEPEVLAPVEERELEEGEREFRWTYNGEEYGITAQLDEEIYDIYRALTRARDYSAFATTPYDDALLEDLAETIADMGRDRGLHRSEIPYLAATFVQSLPYTSDDVTTGFDEYPRFPYETLYDGGGDCEDTAILTAALLDEMGYGTVLLSPPDHMAVGVLCEDNIYGYGVAYQGRRFCYLETTGDGWNVGDMPEEYEGEEMEIYPLLRMPELTIDFTGETRTEGYYTYVDVVAEVRNVGSETAENTQIHISLQTTDENRVWDQITSEASDVEPESGYKYTVTNLKAPSDEYFRIHVVAYAANAYSAETYSEWS